VHILEHDGNLGRVEPEVMENLLGLFSVELALCSEESEELSAGNVVHEEVEVARVLRKATESNLE